jgi:antitoxin VapB
MALSIKNKELEEVTRELAVVTGKPMTEALLVGAKRELERQKTIKRLLNRGSDPASWDRIKKIQERYAAMPNNSTLTDDEILGYDEFGAPTK